MEPKIDQISDAHWPPSDVIDENLAAQIETHEALNSSGRVDHAEGYEMDEEGNRALEATLVALADDVRSGSITWIEDNKGGIADTWSNRVMHAHRSPRRSL